MKKDGDNILFEDNDLIVNTNELNLSGDKLVEYSKSDDKNSLYTQIENEYGNISKEKMLDLLKQSSECPPNKELISVRNIHRTYLIGIEGVPALRGVDLSIKEGDFLVIFGASGGGKTTLLNIIGTIDTPSRGDIKILGKVIRSNCKDKELADIRLNKLSFVFQSFNLFQNLNVLENVELPMRIKGELSENKIKERALYLLEKVGLSKRINHFPNQLSGGEQQRVTIARALVNHPSILLLDEPTGDLDTVNADIVLSLLLELNLLHGITLIMVTHDLSLRNFARRVVRVVDGRIIADTQVNIKDRENSIKDLFDRIQERQGIREGTGLKSKKSDVQSKTVYRKMEDYDILKYRERKNEKNINNNNNNDNNDNNDNIDNNKGI